MAVYVGQANAPLGDQSQGVVLLDFSKEPEHAVDDLTHLRGILPEAKIVVERRPHAWLCRPLVPTSHAPAVSGYDVSDKMIARRLRKRAQQAAEEPAIGGKRALQDIWMAETKNDAEATFETFIDAVKYNKAVACLARDREALLAFYDFPAEHWKHLRTTNPH